jgi:hypothetical protein
MNYLCYKEAFSALVDGNDGVLPDLYEEINFTISCHPTNAPILSTVADVVAYAIIEASHEFRAATIKPQPTILLPVPARISSELLGVERLLTVAGSSYN